MDTKVDTVESYLAAVEPVKRATLEGLRQRIKALIPDAEETISYGIPAFKHNGRMVVYIAAFKNHCSLYPVTEARAEFPEEMNAYKGGKGTMQFSPEAPPPQDLLEKIVRLRLESNALLDKKKG